MKYLIIILFSLICQIQLYAQNIYRTINWESKSNIVPTEKEFSWPHFSGENLRGENHLPFYIENIKIDKNISEVTITDINFARTKIPFEKDSIIPSTINFQYHILKSGSQQYLHIELFPFIKKEGETVRINSFQLQINTNMKSQKGTVTTKSWLSSSILASGKWVKVQARQRGIYKIPFDKLREWGFTSPAEVKMYGNGGYMLPEENDETFYDDLQQIAVWEGRDGDNDDCLFFYSTGTIKWAYTASLSMFTHQQNCYSDDTFFYLTDSGNSLDIQTESPPGQTANKEVSSYDYYDKYEHDTNNLIESGITWYGDKLTPTNPSKSFSFSIPNRINSENLKVYINALSRSSKQSSINLYGNSGLLGTMSYQSVSTTSTEAIYGRTNTLIGTPLINGSDISIETRYIAYNANSEAWIDFIDINSRCHLIFEGSQLAFRDQRSVAPNSITNYKISQANPNIKVWDITDYLHPKAMQTQLSGTNLSFKTSTNNLKEFIAFDFYGDIPIPEKTEDINNQNIHGSSTPDFLIITHPKFTLQAEELAEFHREYDNMDVAVYTTEQIYNEFSSGIPDAAGIRNCIRMFFEKPTSEKKLQYVLLFGDGSFDNKDIRGKGHNLIPTYQSRESLLPTSSFVSDDYFVLLDANENVSSGLIDLGIGRIPARTTNEAEAVVSKIKSYVSANALGKWRNMICLIADDGNIADSFSNTHLKQSESLSDIINQNHSAFFTDKIYFDAYQKESTSGSARYPDVNKAINERVEDGVLIINYIGHANEEFLADEQVLDINTIDSWTNYKNLPIFVTATCEFSRFDADELSAGEHILFNANGGGIGLFSTTRLVYSSENFKLSQSFYNFVFEKDAANGENLRMGDIMKFAKINSPSGINKRNFSLLADPALRLAYPKLNVKTETINGIDVNSFSKTISALEKIDVEGSITDFQGNTVTDFNGTVIPTVYDKALNVETMGNAGQATTTFKTQSNIIYKGNASVKNGKFNFSFIVPKDISYNIDNGKIIYYADNEETDANGAFTNFKIGGSSQTTIEDTQGPEMKVYMNDNSFKSGDKVGASPILIAEVFDENGINTVGTGIGHDITAILDGDNSNLRVLNDYYEADENSYQSGKIVFPLNGLEAGKHTLSLKVWDVVNNSTEVTIEFIISSDFIITQVICYPNPASEYIYLSFNHNLPDELFSTTVEIFNRSGKCIHSEERQIASEGTTSVPFKWNFSDSNSFLLPGFYLVRIKVTSTEGHSTARTGKFIFQKR